MACGGGAWHRLAASEREGLNWREKVGRDSKMVREKWWWERMKKGGKRGKGGSTPAIVTRNFAPQQRACANDGQQIATR